MAVSRARVEQADSTFLQHVEEGEGRVDVPADAPRLRASSRPAESAAPFECRCLDGPVELVARVDSFLLRHGPLDILDDRAENVLRRHPGLSEGQRWEKSPCVSGAVSKECLRVLGGVPEGQLCAELFAILGHDPVDGDLDVSTHQDGRFPPPT
ncbi:uncharacterized protein PSFLO_02213 [Pseudozyma flocculosa]|uniref:Uncharacterized protein n=1 Tax=Pseudozyma flocculosa TaxID=84751 RepID=A0A5C3EXD6_9BASI|nr:uncharacterized protein PSFLO_02213 [Pseudozyma flocculosa]